jgi:hypothetical protein
MQVVGYPAQPAMPWADFVPWAHAVLAAYFAAQGVQAVPWDALDALARSAWRERLGSLDRHQVHGSAACARLAYEQTREHERVVERPALPWGALTAHERGPWHFAAALVASWRAGI